MNTEATDIVKRHTRIGIVLGILIGVCAIAGSIAIAKSQEYDLLAIALLLMLALISFVLAFWGHRWANRSFWIYSHVSPVNMSISAKVSKWSESPFYYEFTLQDESGLNRWVVRPILSGKKYLPLTTQTEECAVYFDPSSKKPDIVETAYGVLWRGGGKAERI